MGLLLNRDQILQAPDLQTEEVEVPEWGGSVMVRGLTGSQRDRYEQSMLQGKGKNQQLNFTNARARLVVLSVVDEKGQPMFTFGDIEALSKKSAAALDRIFSVASRLSGLGEKDFEELTGNLDPAQNDGYGSN